MLSDFIARKHYDFVVDNSWNLYLPLHKNKHTKYIKILHTSVAFQVIHQPKSFFVELKHFDYLIYPASQIDIWQKYHKCVITIPNFIPQIPQKSTDYRQKVVLSVGRFSSEKGFLRLIDIWKIVQEMINNPSLRKSADTSSLRDSASAESWQSTPCHTGHSEVSQKSTNGDSSLTAFAQNDNNIDCHEFDKSNSRNDESNVPSKQSKDLRCCFGLFSRETSEIGLNRPSSEVLCENNSNEYPKANCKQDNAHWKLIIVGDGILKSEIESKIKSLNLQDSIIIKPFTKEIEREYLGASIYAMASHFEGFGMVLAEASSYSLPCIAFDIATGPSDIIAHSKSGYLVSDNDLEGYAKHLITLMSDENLRSAFGAESKRRVSERFSQSMVIQKWQELIENKG
ncbi:glycosyltransferase [Helicobacter sp. T3_23-1059]